MSRLRAALAALAGALAAVLLALTVWPRPEVDIHVEVVPPPTAETVLVSGVPNGLPTGAPGDGGAWERGPVPAPVAAVEDHGWWYAQIEEELEEVVRHCGERPPIVRCEGLACAIWWSDPPESGFLERARRWGRRPERLLYEVAYGAELLALEELPCVDAWSRTAPRFSQHGGRCQARFRWDLLTLDEAYRSRAVPAVRRLCDELDRELRGGSEGNGR